MILTNENYFSQEASKEYMSVSQFKSFDKCEAAAMAEINGEWERPKTSALLVGSYVDSHFEGTLDMFRAKNPEIFTKQGTLKSEYKKAEEIINRIENDAEFMKYLDGAKQVIKTGEIDGIPIKIKIDALHSDKIVDLKIMRDFSPVYKDGQRLPWFMAWGYDLQGIEIPQEFLNERLNYFKGMVQHYVDIKKGLIEPVRCEHCDYCKATKKFKVIDARDYIYEME